MKEQMIHRLIEKHNSKLDDSVGMIYQNTEDFFINNFNDAPFDLVRAIYYGDYDINAPFVMMSSDGSLESLTNEDIIDMVKTWKYLK